MTVSAEIEISAPIDRVWAIVESTESYPSFDPTAVRVLGSPPELNVRMRLYSTVEGERGFTFIVTTFAPPRLMVWTAKAPFGLIRRTRSFILTERARNQVRFVLKEEFTGRLQFLATHPAEELARSFAGFCAGLKELAEA